MTEVAPRDPLLDLWTRQGTWFVAPTGARRATVAWRMLRSRVVQPSGCWYSTLARTGDGYTRFHLDATREVALHRLAFGLLVGPIPDGLDVDHRCHNESACAGGRTCPHRGCWNPAHLDLATRSENSRRGLAARQRWAEHAAA